MDSLSNSDAGFSLCQSETIGLPRITEIPQRLLSIPLSYIIWFLRRHARIKVSQGKKFWFAKNTPNKHSCVSEYIAGVSSIYTVTCLGST